MSLLPRARRRVICEPRDGRPGSGLAVSRSFGDLDFKQPQRRAPDVLSTLGVTCRGTGRAVLPAGRALALRA